MWGWDVTEKTGDLVLVLLHTVNKKEEKNNNFIKIISHGNCMN